MFFTTKTYNVEELRALGCRRPLLIGNSYDPATHRPTEVSPAERDLYGGEVGFIGAWEAERAETLYYLATNGIRVRIWGGGWHKLRRRHERLVVEKRALWAEEDAKAVCSFDICLGFLCKANRDLQTSRTVEIPACQAFLLAERTDEQRALFEEGTEAEFFGSEEELLREIKYYLAHPAERKRIAAAGRERCLRSGYSHHERLKWALNQVLERSLGSQPATAHQAVSRAASVRSCPSPEWPPKNSLRWRLMGGINLRAPQASALRSGT